MKTLYVSDLDGTLMHNDKTISAYTIRTINELISEGLSFTYATARTIKSAKDITEALQLKLPVITRNGAVLADNGSGKLLSKALFTENEVLLLERLLPELPECGFVSCFLGDHMIKTFFPKQHTEEFQRYLEDRKGDIDVVPVKDSAGMFTGQPGYVTLIGSREKLAPVHERVSAYAGWECVFQKDIYRDEYWLEICPQNSTKAKAILKLKNDLGFERLVVFGDSLNDLPMFRAADEAYAVSNAAESLKAAAAAVIGSNEEDAVARFLRQRAVY